MSTLKRVLLWFVAPVLLVGHAVSTSLAQQGPREVTFSGRVLDGRAKPVQGAEVYLLKTVWRTGLPAEVSRITEAKTSGDGSFRFRIEAGADCTILAKKSGLAWSWLNWNADEDDQGEMTLTEPKELAGQVVDAKGGPVADAEVTLAAARTGKGNPRFLENAGWELAEPVARRTVLSRTDHAGRFVLEGLPLPTLDGIKIDLDKTPIKDKRVLVCFFDVEQRPSRQAAQRLSTRAAGLAEKGVVVLAVDLSKTETSARTVWIANQKIQIPVGTVTGDSDEVRVAWGVKALPWLVLADAGHVVKAEGFALGELDAVLAR